MYAYRVKGYYPYQRQWVVAIALHRDKCGAFLGSDRKLDVHMRTSFWGSSVGWVGSRIKGFGDLVQKYLKSYDPEICLFENRCFVQG